MNYHNITKDDMLNASAGAQAACDEQDAEHYNGDVEIFDFTGATLL
ncbi:MAG: hypothetical protein IJ877_02860 [Candidatus Gastranaerophilales bacterium]|nr:hypothetical protein [Candidatus Gastranaerophilales bacterium]